MLGTVPVVRFKPKPENPLRAAFICGVGYQIVERRVGIKCQPIYMNIDFKPRPSRVIHQKKTGPVVGSQIAGADVLSVAAIIGKGQSSLINDFEKTGFASTMLNVGPARFRD